ncbi:hypothetical protein EVAR_61138_1 [Eumeta japonica]|uniref:Uncharacterized protein n=1 Tax=Eumeta variegata TaxID=151549 RepID=A0A4C2AC73_EUMVA|nr:hypothetical protein EVAR_61138_1 [Eumeta japonica]
MPLTLIWVLDPAREPRVAEASGNSFGSPGARITRRVARRPGTQNRDLVATWFRVSRFPPERATKNFRFGTCSSLDGALRSTPKSQGSSILFPVFPGKRSPLTKFPVFRGAPGRKSPG